MSDENSNWVVLKFGGTSVSTRENWENILSVIKRRKSEGYAVCVVHSALSGISNTLEEIIDRAPEGNCNELVEAVKEKHCRLAEELNVSVEDLLNDDFDEFEHIVKGIELIGEASFRVQARLLAMGELMATKIGATFLKDQLGEAVWFDARKLIKTVNQKNVNERSHILSAVSPIDYDSSARDALASAGSLLVTQGFIGSDR